MAITITPEISSQSVSSAKSYKYLFEPLRIKIAEAGSTYAKISASLRNTVTGVETKMYTDYAFNEMNLAGEVIIDLMEITRDFVGGEIYKIGSIADLQANPMILPGFYIVFNITTELTSTPIIISIIPLVGGRSYEQWVGSVVQTSPVTEWWYHGMLQPDFKGYPKILTGLRDPSGTNVEPLITISIPTVGREVCGGYLIWKSRFGGWMTYGFDIFAETEELKYENELDSALFQASPLGNPYIPVNYTQVMNSYSVTMKALSVSKTEAQVLRSLASTPAAYLMRTPSSKLELMRISSVGIPINNLANGVDISIALSSISQSTQNVR